MMTEYKLQEMIETLGEIKHFLKSLGDSHSLYMADHHTDYVQTYLKRCKHLKDEWSKRND